MKETFSQKNKILTLPKDNNLTFLQHCAIWLSVTKVISTLTKVDFVKEIEYTLSDFFRSRVMTTGNDHN